MTDKMFKNYYKKIKKLTKGAFRRCKLFGFACKTLILLHAMQEILICEEKFHLNLRQVKVWLHQSSLKSSCDASARKAL